MVKKNQFTLLFVPYFEFRGTNYIRNLFRFCVVNKHPIHSRVALGGCFNPWKRLQKEGEDFRLYRISRI